VIGPVRDVLDKFDLIPVIGEDNFYLTVHEAVLSLKNQTEPEKNYKNYTLQTNQIS
jgi:hypothetical protein